MQDVGEGSLWKSLVRQIALPGLDAPTWHDGYPLVKMRRIAGQHHCCYRNPQPLPRVIQTREHPLSNKTGTTCHE